MSTLPATRPARLALAVATGRVVVGVVLLVHPDWLTRSLGADSRTARRLRYLPRMAGGRDAAIGAGGLYALTAGRGATGWLVAAAAADSVDAIAVGTAAARGDVARLAGSATALSAVAAAAVSLQAVRRRSAAPPQ